MNNNSKFVVCSDCGQKKKLDEQVSVGDIVECDECGTELEILSLEPLKYQELVEEK